MDIDHNNKAMKKEQDSQTVAETLREGREIHKTFS